MSKQTPIKVNISGIEYEIVKELEFHSHSDVTNYMKRYNFFEVKGKEFFMQKIAANYHGFWAVGENFYDAADKLESKMFVRNRAMFLEFIDSQRQVKTK